MQRHILHSQYGEKVVLIGEIADRPDEARRHRLGTSLQPELDFPLHSIPVPYDELRVRAIEVFFDERVRAVRLVFLPAGTIEQIACGNVGGVAPQYRRPLTRNFSFRRWGLFALFRYARGRKAQDNRRKKTRNYLSTLTHTITPPGIANIRQARRMPNCSETSEAS